MREIELYVHPTCTSCRKAQAWLDEHHVVYERRDYFRDRFTRDELAGVLASAGLTPRDVLSKRARAYKELVGDRELTDDQLLDLMIEEPTLLRRRIGRVRARCSDRVRSRGARADRHWRRGI